MLVYFSAENFRSIKEPIELDMRAAPKLRRLAHHSRKPLEKSKLKLLKSALIYGANASGKSNILKAMQFAKSLITHNKSSIQNLESQKFSLINDMAETSSYYFEFIIAKTHLSYGFEISDDRVIEEELNIYDAKSETSEIVFNRKFNEITNEYEIQSNLGEEDAFNEFKILCKYTSKDSLLINKSSEWTESSDLGNIGKLLKGARAYFQHFLIIIFPDTRYTGLARDLLSSGNDGEYLNHFHKFDTGIDSIETNEISIGNFDSELIKDIKEALIEQASLTFYEGDDEYTAWFKDNKLVISSLKAVHKVKGVKAKSFKLHDESDGTIRLLDLLPALAEEEEHINPYTYVIDEFDRSLHPNLSRSIIETFLNCKSKNNNQLIVTTHQSELLDSKLLRRDEIWFVQKEWDQSSKLYSLDDYSERFDKDIQKAYLSGKYGAVPILNDNTCVSESYGT